MENTGSILEKGSQLNKRMRREVCKWTNKDETWRKSKKYVYVIRKIECFV